MKNKETKEQSHTQGDWAVAQRTNKRTPLEIRTVQKCEGAQLGISICKLTEINAEANAKRIVKCVNMHDELVDTLTNVSKIFSDLQIDGAPVDASLKKITELLKQAEQE